MTPIVVLSSLVLLVAPSLGHADSMWKDPEVTIDDLVMLMDVGEAPNTFFAGDILEGPPKDDHEKSGSCLLDKARAIIQEGVHRESLNDLRLDLAACCIVEGQSIQRACVKDLKKSDDILTSLMRASDGDRELDTSAAGIAQLLFKAARKRLQVANLTTGITNFIRDCQKKPLLCMKSSFGSQETVVDGEGDGGIDDDSDGDREEEEEEEESDVRVHGDGDPDKTTAKTATKSAKKVAQKTAKTDKKVVLKMAKNKMKVVQKSLWAFNSLSKSSHTKVAKARISCWSPVCKRVKSGQKCEGETCCDKQILEALVAITDFMNKHSIKYVLLLGTLLGAHRDRAILPWDHDLDIGIDMRDFGKFVNQTEIPFHFEHRHGCEWHHPGFPGEYRKSDFDNVHVMAANQTWGGGYFIDFWDVGQYNVTLNKTRSVYIQGRAYKAPLQTDSLLEKWYGKGWKAYGGFYP